MKIAIVIFLVIGFLVLLAYLKLPPPYASKKLVGIFNKMVIAVAFVICLMFYLSGRVNLPFSESMREVMAVAGAVGIEIVFLLICFLLRNFWIFKTPRRPGGGMF